MLFRSISLIHVDPRVMIKCEDMHLTTTCQKNGYHQDIKGNLMLYTHLNSLFLSSIGGGGAEAEAKPPNCI